MKIMKMFSVLIIIFGLGIFLVPIVGQRTTSYLENKMISDWQNGTTETNSRFYTNLYNAYNKIVDTFSPESQSEGELAQNMTQIKGATTKSTLEGKKTKLKQKVIGVIEIPEIDVKREERLFLHPKHDILWM